MCRGLSKDKLEKGIAVFALNHTQKSMLFLPNALPHVLSY